MASTPNRFLQFFLGIGRAFIPNKIFSCSLILGTSVHEKTFQMGGGGGGGLVVDRERVAVEHASSGLVRGY